MVTDKGIENRGLALKMNNKKTILYFKVKTQEDAFTWDTIGNNLFSIYYWPHIKTSGANILVYLAPINNLEFITYLIPSILDLNQFEVLVQEAWTEEDFKKANEQKITPVSEHLAESVVNEDDE